MSKPKPEAPEELPVVVSFGMRKHADKHVAVAVRSQGLKVLQSLVLEADRNREHVLFVMQRKLFEHYTLGRNPFDG